MKIGRRGGYWSCEDHKEKALQNFYCNRVRIFLKIENQDKGGNYVQEM
jgi:hypothetical protein